MVAQPERKAEGFSIPASLCAWSRWGLAVSAFATGEDTDRWQGPCVRVALAGDRQMDISEEQGDLGRKAASCLREGWPLGRAGAGPGRGVLSCISAHPRAVPTVSPLMSPKQAAWTSLVLPGFLMWDQ